MSVTKIQEAEKRLQSHSEVTLDALFREQAREQEQARRAKFYSKWMGLSTAMKNKSIVPAVVSGVRESDMKGKYIVEAKIEDELLCKIPFDLFYMENPVKRETCKNDKEFVKRQFQMARKLIKAKISVIISTMEHGDTEDLDDYEIFGSRQEALMIQEKANFEPKKNGKAAINVGDFVRVSITAVGEHSINVNVGGVDTSIQKWGLTYKYIPDLRTEYFPGQMIIVQIVDVQKQENGHYKVFVVHKSVELEEAKRSTAKLTVGTICTGIVSSMKEENNIPKKVYFWLNGYDRPASADNSSTKLLYKHIDIGQEIQVTVLKIADNGMVRCRIIGTNSPCAVSII